MNFLIGSGSAALAYTFVYPIDVIKIQYQKSIYDSQLISTYKPKKAKIHNIIKNIYQKQGFKGFYKGYNSNLFTYPIFWGICFDLKPFFKQNGYNEMSSVYIAACIASLITNPLFVLKSRFQTAILDTKLSPTYYGVTTNIYKNEGIKSFFKGYPITSVDNLKLCGLLSMTEYLKDKYINDCESQLNKNLKMAGISGFSKLSVSMVTYPSDYIRNLQRVSKVDKSIMEICGNIHVKSGILGFYKGISLQMGIKVPNFVIMMVIKSWLENYN